jgi:type IV secretion system protein VirB5
MKKIICILAFLTSVTSGQAFAGIPVIDAGSIAQAVLQVESWGQQYKQMTQQILQLQQQIQAVTGSRGFSSALNSPSFQQARRMLPQDAQALLDLAHGGSYGDLSKTISNIKLNTTTLNRDNFSTQLGADLWEADLNRAASNKALSMEAYNSAQQRLSNLESLMSQISTTDDPKAIGELQARIATEQGLIQNEQAKIQAMTMLVSAEKQISEMQSREVSIRSSGMNQSLPRMQVTP